MTISMSAASSLSSVPVAVGLPCPAAVAKRASTPFAAERQHVRARRPRAVATDAKTRGLGGICSPAVTIVRICSLAGAVAILRAHRRVGASRGTCSRSNRSLGIVARRGLFKRLFQRGSRDDTDVDDTQPTATQNVNEDAASLTNQPTEVDVMDTESLEEYFRQQAEAKYKAAVGTEWSAKEEDKMKSEEERMKDKWVGAEPEASVPPQTAAPVSASPTPVDEVDTPIYQVDLAEALRERENAGPALSFALACRDTVSKFFDVLVEFARWVEIEWEKNKDGEWQEWLDVGQQLEGMKQGLEREYQARQARAERLRNRKISLDILESSKRESKEA